MGKKSRRKGGNTKQKNKAAAGERPKEQGKDDAQGCYQRPFFVGDRVWFVDSRSDGSQPNSYRGVIQRVEDKSLDVLPLQAKYNGQHQPWNIPIDKCFPDFCNMTLRFEVGEQVLCNTCQGWQQATVDYQWPIYELRDTPTTPECEVPHYKCGLIAAQHDSDDLITQRPSSFRLAIGDQVHVNTLLAKPLGNITRAFFHSAAWLAARVTQLDILGRRDYYAYYECQLHLNGRKIRCLILQDDDEHIAKLDATPRERLFQAIQQDCTPNHLSYLVSFFSIDVTAFRDLVLAKAIEFASYNTLLWIQDNHSIHISDIRDIFGNNLMHQIAKSPHAIRFLQKVSRKMHADESTPKLEIIFSRPNLVNETNKDGRTWLDILVDQNNVKALDYALSPNSDLAWNLTSHHLFSDDNFTTLRNSALKMGDPTMQFIIESFASFRIQAQQQRCLEHCVSGSQDNLLGRKEMLDFQGENASYSAIRLARFFHDWRGHPNDQVRTNPFLNLVRLGFFRLFQLFFESDSDLFLRETTIVHSRADKNEYTQPQLNITNDSLSERERGDLISVCLTGDTMSRPNNADFDERQSYFDSLRRYVNSSTRGKFLPLISYLKSEHESLRQNCFRREALLEFKIEILEDDNSLQGRLEILNYLIDKEPKTYLNVLTAIRSRQCGVLRWMVAKKFLKLDMNASEDMILLKNAEKCHFTNNYGHVPSSMTVGCLLCYAAVEYDDLQSLQWLSESYGLPVGLHSDWNLLHFCSYLGRVEIVIWLHTQPIWSSLVREACNRKPFKNAYAAHIAVMKGHITLANYILKFGCNQHDRKGRLLDYYAKKSGYDFIQKWSNGRNLPKLLERNIEELMELLNAKNIPIENLKKYILTSKCLDINSWCDCYYHRFDTPGPMGKTFVDIVSQCCKHHDEDFVLWLYTMLYLSPERHFRDCFWDNDVAKEGHIQPKELQCDELLLFAIDNNYHDLVFLLSKRWAKKITCNDPITQNISLSTAIEDNRVLHKIRSKLLRALILITISKLSRSEIKSLFEQGGNPGDIDDVLSSFNQVISLLNDEGYFSSEFMGGHICSFDKKFPIDMNSYLCTTYRDNHPIRKQLPYRWESNNTKAKLHLVLAIEGYSELTKWCFANLQGWTAEMELEMVRVSSFFGHSAMLNIFFDSIDTDYCLRSEADHRRRSAMIGAGEAGRFRDMLHYSTNNEASLDPVNEKNGRLCSRYEQRSLLRKSLVCAVINGHITGTFDRYGGDKDSLEMFTTLVNRLRYTPATILYAMELFLANEYKEERLIRFLEILQNVIDHFQLQPILHSKQIVIFCEKMVEFVEAFAFRTKEKKEKENFESKILQWLEIVVGWGVDIQGLPKPVIFDLENDFTEGISRLKKKQLTYWSKFDAVKQGGNILDIQHSIENGHLKIYERDRGGQLLTHIAAAYDRVDILEWLVVAKKINLESVDEFGRTALDVAKASKALSTSSWINEWQALKVIKYFVRRRRHQILAFQRYSKLRRSATAIQKIHRGNLTRKIFRGTLLLRLEESQRFLAIWTPSIQSLPSMVGSLSSWSSIRERVTNIRRPELLDFEFDFEDTDQKLNKALEDAVQNESNSSNYCNLKLSMDAVEDSTRDSNAADVKDVDTLPIDLNWSTFQMSSHVVKFLKHGDTKYRELFVKRMRQLANGDRSRILQKRLKGSQSVIFETYLEQKSGFRILWTESNSNIVIWFVAKHKCVSRLIKLIDDSKSRSSRHQAPESFLNEPQNGATTLPSSSKKELLLDVLGNVPMKVYDVNFHSIDELTQASWNPRLHLTEEERGVVETDGTVLLLGRSGTGKTICICNRMEFDRQKFGYDPFFTQLFVSRSARLCRYVAEIVGSNESSSFITFGELLCQLESSIPRSTSKKSFLPSQRVDFYRFKYDFYEEKNFRENLDSLVVWKMIRTFIKGSIEAFQSAGSFLPKDYFVETEKLGKNRCTVSSDIRGFIYDVFLQYKKYIDDHCLWDDCDRIVSLLQRINEAKNTDPSVHEKIKRSKVYVDEIQDYSQIECLLFFYLGGPRSLFLAGDPAQSVVEGTDFRFEEIRSIGYFVTDQKGHNAIPQKPKTVNVNFRSHTGILNTAAAVLDFLFTFFPSSTKQTKKDSGLFYGPRPGVCHKVDAQLLADLLSEKLRGAIVLTHDESVSRWKRSLNGYPLVYGIREAKGLEFKSVVLLDFFCELPSTLHKPWRNLLLKRADSNFGRSFPIVETHLKLLYTAVTRCIEQLFFVETRSSIPGDAAVRWLTSPSTEKIQPDRSLNNEQRHNEGSLATRNNSKDLEAMTMTCDEWLSVAIDNAEAAESDEIKLSQAEELLDRAVYCFDQAENLELATKARTHRLSIKFRLELMETDTSPLPSNRGLSKNDAATLEMKAAQLTESLLRENLLLEALNLHYSVSPFLSSYTKQELRKNLVPMIKEKIDNDSYPMQTSKLSTSILHC